MSKQAKIELTDYEMEILQGVLKGADIWGYAEAGALRSIQKKASHLIDIVPAMEKPPGHMQQPYFGCIATKDGRKFLRAALARCKGGE